MSSFANAETIVSAANTTKPSREFHTPRHPSVRPNKAIAAETPDKYDTLFGTRPRYCTF